MRDGGLHVPNRLPARFERNDEVEPSLRTIGGAPTGLDGIAASKLRFVWRFTASEDVQSRAAEDVGHLWGIRNGQGAKTDYIVHGWSQPHASARCNRNSGPSPAVHKQSFELQSAQGVVGVRPGRVGRVPGQV